MSDLSPYLSAIEQIRETSAQYLRGLGTFAGVTVLTRQQGDPFQRAQETLGKSGVVVIVAVLSAVPRAIQSRRVELNPIPIIVECTENVPVNQSATGTQKGALFLAEQAVVAFQLWTPPLPPELSPSTFTPEPPGIETLPTLKEYPNMHTVQAHFSTRCSLPPRQD